MKSHLRFLGHPVHQLLIVFPLGLLITSVAYDAIYLATKKKDHASTANKLVGAGVLTGLAAAATGLVDWAAIPAGTRAKRVGNLHALGNAVLLLLFGASWKLRQGNPEKPPRSALALSLLGLLLGNATAWLGGELVVHHGVGVEDNADLDAEGLFVS